MDTAATVSNPIRDQVGDHLLTPKNSALLAIDYQPSQLAGVRSMDRDLLLKNVVSTAKVAKLFGLPIVHSTVNVKAGRGKPTLSPLAEVLADNPPIDRTTTNAWEDPRGDSAYRTTAQGGIKLTKGIIGIGNFGRTRAASSPLAAQRRAM
jgi:nicotinamidase-related amidase